jgi:hypothetical protein
MTEAKGISETSEIYSTVIWPLSAPMIEAEETSDTSEIYEGVSKSFRTESITKYTTTTTTTINTR